MGDIFQYEAINIDLKQNYGIGYDLECHQNDLITLNFIIRNYGEIVDLTTYSVELRVKRSDGSDYIQGGTTGITKGANGNLKIVCKDSLTNVGGIAKGELRIWDSARNQATTRILRIDIKNSALNVNRSLSQTTITILEELNNNLNNAYDVQNDFANKIDNASKSKTELGIIINTANTTKSNLDSSNVTALSTKSNLDESNSTALATKSALDTSNTNASKTKSDLDTLNTRANTTKTNLDSSNATANATKSALDTSNTNANATKSALDTSNTNASKTKSDLETLNNNATTTKNDLTTLNNNAQVTKTDLTTLNNNAIDNAKTLDTKNTLAVKNIEAMGSFGDVTTIAKDVTSIKNEITDARGDYDNLNERIVNIIGKDVANLYIGDTEPELDGLWVDTSGAVGEVGSNDILNNFKDYVGDKTKLKTNDKSNFVNAINEHETKINNNTTQLNANVQEIKNNLSPQITNKPIFVFIDDDCTSTFLTNLKPTFDAKGIKITLACIIDNVGTQNFMTKEQLLMLQNEGNEIVSHTKTHSSSIFRDNIATTPESDYIIEFKNSLEWLNNNGFKGSNTVVYPYGGYSSENALKIKKIASKFYAYGINANGSYNESPLDNIYMDRVFLDKTKPVSNFTTIIDNCIKNNGFLIFGTHGGNPSQIDGDYLGQIIDYIISKNGTILTLNEALAIKGNSISIGEFTSNSNFFVSKDGSTRGNGLGVNVIRGVYSGTMNDDITNFEKYKTTIFEINTSKDTFLGLGGVMHVFRGDNYYSYELYYISNGKRVYYRIWNEATSSWGSWVEVTNDIYVSVSNFTGTMDDSITTYETNKRTTIEISNSKDTFLGVGGIMTIYRGSAYYSYATYMTSNNDGMYTRIWNESTSSWASWVRIDKQYIQSLDTTSRTNSDLITSFPIGIEYCDINSSNSTGFPDTMPGILKTVRSGSLAACFQEYYPRQSLSTYKRIWDSTNNMWGTWTKITLV